MAPKIAEVKFMPSAPVNCLMQANHDRLLAKIKNMESDAELRSHVRAAIFAVLVLWSIGLTIHAVSVGRDIDSANGRIDNVYKSADNAKESTDALYSHLGLELVKTPASTSVEKQNPDRLMFYSVYFGDK